MLRNPKQILVSFLGLTLLLFSSACLDQGISFVRSYPADNAAEVPLNAVVAVVFKGDKHIPKKKLTGDYFKLILLTEETEEEKKKAKDKSDTESETTDEQGAGGKKGEPTYRESLIRGAIKYTHTTDQNGDKVTTVYYLPLPGANATAPLPEEAPLNFVIEPFEGKKYSFSGKTIRFTTDEGDFAFAEASELGEMDEDYELQPAKLMTSEEGIFDKDTTFSLTFANAVNPTALADRSYVCAFKDVGEEYLKQQLGISANRNASQQPDASRIETENVRISQEMWSNWINRTRCNAEQGAKDPSARPQCFTQQEKYMILDLGQVREIRTLAGLNSLLSEDTECDTEQAEKTWNERAATDAEFCLTDTEAEIVEILAENLENRQQTAMSRRPPASFNSDEVRSAAANQTTLNCEQNKKKLEVWLFENLTVEDGIITADYNRYRLSSNILRSGYGYDLYLATDGFKKTHHLYTLSGLGSPDAGQGSIEDWNQELIEALGGKERAFRIKLGSKGAKDKDLED